MNTDAITASCRVINQINAWDQNNHKFSQTRCRQVIEELICACNVDHVDADPKYLLETIGTKQINRSTKIMIHMLQLLASDPDYDIKPTMSIVLANLGIKSAGYK